MANIRIMGIYRSLNNPRTKTLAYGSPGEIEQIFEKAIWIFVTPHTPVDTVAASKLSFHSTNTGRGLHDTRHIYLLDVNASNVDVDHTVLMLNKILIIYCFRFVLLSVFTLLFCCSYYFYSW